MLWAQTRGGKSQVRRGKRCLYLGPRLPVWRAPVWRRVQALAPLPRVFSTQACLAVWLHCRYVQTRGRLLACGLLLENSADGACAVGQRDLEIVRRQHSEADEELQKRRAEVAKMRKVVADLVTTQTRQANREARYVLGAGKYGAQLSAPPLMARAS